MAIQRHSCRHTESTHPHIYAIIPENQLNINLVSDCECSSGPIVKIHLYLRCAASMECCSVATLLRSISFIVAAALRWAHVPPPTNVAILYTLCTFRHTNATAHSTRGSFIPVACDSAAACRTEQFRSRSRALIVRRWVVGCARCAVNVTPYRNFYGARESEARNVIV